MNGSKCTLRDKYGNPLGSYDSHDDFTRDLYGNPSEEAICSSPC